MGASVAAEITPSPCNSSLLNSFPENEHGGCRPYSMYDADAESLVDEVSCHFENQISLYAYAKNGQLKLDIKGLSGRSFEGASNSVNQTKEFADCDSLRLEIEKYSEQISKKTYDAPKRDLKNRENVLLVSSETTCRQMQDSLNAMLTVFRNEGRSSSSVLCLENSLLQTKNPSLVHARIRAKTASIDGILLIGSDIPPFEYFYRTGYDDSTAWSAYKYGTTDLPYGSTDDDFWARPLSKNQKNIGEIVYRSRDYMYGLDYPTPWAFNFDDWVSKFQNNGAYRQTQWVARWLTDDLTSKAWSSFVQRRRDYLPPEFHRVTFAMGSVSFMLRPEKHESWERLQNELKPFMSNLPPESTLEVLAEADLRSTARFVPKTTSFLVLNDHGNPTALGNITTEIGDQARWLPPIVNLDSCLTGSWSYAGGLHHSFIAKIFRVENPPLAVVASQGIMELSVMGGSSTHKEHDVFLDGWKVGQSLGQRQIETINNNLKAWRLWPKPHPFLKPSFFPAQIFLTTSIFGDGTIEL